MFAAVGLSHVNACYSDELACPTLALRVKDRQDLSQHRRRPHPTQAGDGLQQYLLLHQKLPQTLVELCDLFNQEVETLDDEANSQLYMLAPVWPG